MIVESALFALAILFLLIAYSRKPSDLPPGKWGFPLIGYLPLKGESNVDLVRRLSPQYGKIFSVKIGVRLFVFLSDYATIKATFGKAEFSGRFNLYTWNLYHHFEKKGIALNEGHSWATNRKFALKVLKDFGMGKSILEDSINVEVQSLIQEWKSKANKPSTIDWSLNVAILNVTWRIIANKRFDLNDQEIHNFSKLVEEIILGFDGPSQILNIHPWIIPIMPKFVEKWLKIDECKKNRDTLLNYFQKIITEHKENLDKENLMDYIDIYLMECDDEAKVSESSISKEHYDLIASLFDLFIAGSETTSTSIRWFMFYMMTHPEIQRKVQQEIDSIVSKEKFPSLEDKDKLPYLEASVYETLRLSAFIPLGVPHGALEDSQINGYKIPKGTILISCIDVCHHSEEYWEKPHEFYPEHFINEERKFYVRKEGFLPFSLGRRQCLGESLAKMELFLFAGAILQSFTIGVPEGQKVDMKQVTTGTTVVYPPKIKFYLKKRV